MFKNTKAFNSFSVDNLEKAKEFYSKILGLEISDSSMGTLEMTINGGNKVLIYPKPDHQPASFIILNFPVDNIDKAVDKLTASGVKFEKYEGKLKTDEKGIFRKEGPNIAWFKDPAGNILSVIETT